MRLTLVVALLAGLACAVQTARLALVRADFARLEADLAAARLEARVLREDAHAARAGSLAISAQAQSCLDREATAAAESLRMLEILEAATPRPTTEAERAQAPDDVTRRALLEAMDAPL